MNISKILKILSKEIKNFKNPIVKNVADIYKTPFHILIATILSARTKDSTTEMVSKKLFEKVKSVYDLNSLNLKQIENLIYPVGFYRIKAKNLKKLTKILIEKYNGSVPDKLEELLKLPGVGRKTANLVLIEAFNKYGICVDTHVHRILNRLGYVNTKTPEETEFQLRKILPKKFWKKINEILVIYGQNMCKPINPKCSLCKVKIYCNFYKNLNSLH
jgi:endonuclease-3